MELTAQNVMETMKGCMFNDDTPQEEVLKRAVIVEGILCKFGFDPDRLKAKEADIVSMLEQLPTAFRRDVGGGYSFLGACNREDGVQWTGLHKLMDELFCLGMAIGKVSSVVPREMWQLMPGGMPYFTIDFHPKEAA